MANTTTNDASSFANLKDSDGNSLVRPPEREKEVYLVWQGGEDEQFYNQYFSLMDAVKNEDENAEIFKADLKSLGSFKLVTKAVKTKRSKRKKKK